VSEFETRFKGCLTLYGTDACLALEQAHICVIGLGGVGSWVVESLARSGIGNLTLVDLDEVCISNINRQIQALSETIGQTKSHILKTRIQQINPTCKVNLIDKFFSVSTCESILNFPYSLVIDCIDGVSAKALLIAECTSRNIPIISTGSAGNRKSPLGIEVADLAFTKSDTLLFKVRKKLRQYHQFPRDTKLAFNVPCVYLPLEEESQTCRVPESPANNYKANKITRNNCNHGLGSTVFVTASIGLFAASEAVGFILKS